MEVKFINSENTLTVKVTGRLDTNTSSQFQEELKKHIDDVKELVIDMEQLTYISSAGLRVILFAQKKMNTQGKMVIKNANETIMEVFTVTGFTEILTIQ